MRQIHSIDEENRRGVELRRGKYVKLRRHKSGSSYSYVITIPKVLVELVLKWNPGDRLRVEEREIEGKRGVFIYKDE